MTLPQGSLTRYYSLMCEYNEQHHKLLPYLKFYSPADSFCVEVANIFLAIASPQENSLIFLS